MGSEVECNSVPKCCMITVFEAEVVGLSLAVELVRTEENVGTAMISSNSQAAIQATQSTRGASGWHLVDTVHERIEAERCKHKGLNIELRWTPGHKGILENKWADTEAKRAAQGESSQRCRLPAACRGTIPA